MREDYFFDDTASYLEFSIMQSHYNSWGSDLYVVDIIKWFYESCNEVLDWHQNSKDQWVREKAKEFIFKGLLPMTFKYIKGLHSHYFENSIQTKNNNLQQIKQSVDIIFELFFEKLESIGKIIDYENIDSLVPKEEVDFIKEFYARKQAQPQSPEFIKKCTEEMEHDEYVNSDLYVFRKTCETLMQAVEQLIPSDIKYEISKFSRPCAIKRNWKKRNDTSDTTVKQNYQNQNTLGYQQNFNKTFSYGQNTGIVEDLKTAKPLYREFKEAIKYYIDDKKRNMDMKGDTKNILVSCFTQNPSFMKYLSTFVMKMIFEKINPDTFILTKAEKE